LLIHADKQYATMSATTAATGAATAKIFNFAYISFLFDGVNAKTQTDFFTAKFRPLTKTKAARLNRRFAVCTCNCSIFREKYNRFREKYEIA
jgi:hypothetical protein